MRREKLQIKEQALQLFVMTLPMRPQPQVERLPLFIGENQKLLKF